MYQAPRAARLHPTDLGLVERLYFLYLDELKGHLAVAPHTASLGLITADLIGLIDNGYVTAHPKTGALRSRRPSHGPPASPLAHTVWDRILYEEPALPAEDWLRYWAIEDYFTAVSEQMVYRGLLHRTARRTWRGADVVAYDRAHVTLSQGPFRELQRAFADAHHPNLTHHDLRLVAVLDALNLTRRLGVALEEAHLNAFYRHLPPPVHLLITHLRQCTGTAAMTNRT
nr:GPP34 family phosphoprotein [Glycomyces amatae]